MPQCCVTILKMAKIAPLLFHIILAGLRQLYLNVTRTTQRIRCIGIAPGLGTLTGLCKI
jgi:hypothetical protein